MPAPPLLDISVPRREIDRLHREIEQYLAQTAAQATRPATRRRSSAPVKRSPLQPDAAEMIRQAGIITGPAPRQPGRIARALQGRRRSVGIAEHLDATVRIIELYGWAQHTTWDRQRRCCIIGAQSLAVHLGYGDRQTAGEAGAWLNRQLGGGTTYVTWQNNRYRTKADVLSFLRRAAADARKAGH